MSKRILAFVISLTVLCGIFCPMTQVNAAGNYMNIHSIYLGDGINGDATLIESNGEYILMDLGDAASYGNVKKYLDSLNVKKLSLYISHFHGDHTAGLGSDGKLQQFLSDYQVTRVYLPDKSIFNISTDAKKTAYYNDNMAARYTWVENRLRGKGYDPDTVICYLKKGSTFNVGSAKFNIIGPVHPENYTLPSGKADEKEDDYQNNCSLVCRVVCGNQSFLTAGDMKNEGENDLIASYGNGLKSNIYKMSHHGMYPANSANFLKYVRPDYSFASNAASTAIVNYGSNGRQVRQTYTQRLNCAEYGFVYTLGEEKKSLLIQVKDNRTSLKREGDSKNLNADGWTKVYGADGVYEKYDYYYFKNGVTLKGIQKIDGAYYNLGNGGCKQIGTYKKSGNSTVYYGWDVESDGRRRYYAEKSDKSKDAAATDYAMYTGKKYVQADNKVFYFDKNTGYLITGSTPKGWEVKKIDGDTYAVYGSGMLKTSSWLVDEKGRRYFDAEGKMAKGWQNIGGFRYYLNSKSGYATTGFKKIGSKYYLFWDSGKAAVNNVSIIDGYYCSFNHKAQWTNIPKVQKVKLKKIKRTGKGKVKLSWDTVESSGYQVYMSKSKKGTYKKVKTIKSGSKASYQQKKLKSGKTYYFKVRTYRKIGGYTFYSKFSSAQKVKTK